MRTVYDITYSTLLNNIDASNCAYSTVPTYSTYSTQIAFRKIFATYSIQYSKYSTIDSDHVQMFAQVGDRKDFDPKPTTTEDVSVFYSISKTRCLSVRSGYGGHEVGDALLREPLRVEAAAIVGADPEAARRVATLHLHL